MTFSTIDSLRSALGKAPNAEMRPETPEYAEKMMHPVPEAPTVRRNQFLFDLVKGKSIIHVGASGPLHTALLESASIVIGWDRDATAVGVIAIDLDDPLVALPQTKWTPDFIVCGEILEHLANPGWFLHRLHDGYPGVRVIITVPNAFSQVARKHIKAGVENVNQDHVAWYSHHTLKVLLGRYGYAISELYWYGGPPLLAEGLIVVTA